MKTVLLTSCSHERKREERKSRRKFEARERVNKKEWEFHRVEIVISQVNAKLCGIQLASWTYFQLYDGLRRDIMSSLLKSLELGRLQVKNEISTGWSNKIK